MFDLQKKLNLIRNDVMIKICIFRRNWGKNVRKKLNIKPTLT